MELVNIPVMGHSCRSIAMIINTKLQIFQNDCKFYENQIQYFKRHTKHFPSHWIMFQQMYKWVLWYIHIIRWAVISGSLLSNTFGNPKTPTLAKYHASCYPYGVRDVAQCLPYHVAVGWRHGAEKLSALLALCGENPYVTDGFPITEDR